MNDLRNRFTNLDTLRAPDLWHDSKARAAAAAAPASRGLSWVLISAALILALLIGGVALVGAGIVKLPALVDNPTTSPSASTGATPSPWPSPIIFPTASRDFWSTPGPWASPGSPVSFDGIGSPLLSGIVYTSNRFMPQVSFRLPAFGGKEQTGVGTDWCPVTQSSARSIVLPYLQGCVSDLRILRPYAVDCGTADLHPDADSLARAILANPGLTPAKDYGSLADAARIAPGMDFSGFRGRVMYIYGAKAFASTVANPDGCRLLAEPGSHDPVIEVRGDLSSLLILIDVRGQLVVIRLASGGYDAPTGTAAQNRGYRDFPDDVAAAILAYVRDFHFLR